MKITKGIKFLFGEPSCLRWSIWTGLNKKKSILMLDVGFDEVPFMFFYLGLKSKNKIRIKSKIHGLYEYQIEFLFNKDLLYFDSDDWGGGRILPSNEDYTIDDICSVLKNDKRFLFLGENSEDDVRVQIV